MAEVIFPRNELGNDPADFQDDPDTTARIIAEVKTAKDKAKQDEASRRPSHTTIGMKEILCAARVSLPWCVERTLIKDTLNIIFGAPKEMKTFVALDMAMSQATGLPFLGTYKVLEKGLVIYCAGEGIAGIGHRINAWCIERGIRDPELIPFRRTLGAVQISDGGAALLGEEIQSILDANSNTPLVGIYIDTLARNFGEGDENSTPAMNVFVAQCDLHLKSRFKVPVTVVHHSGHNETQRPRGSIALMGAADCIIKVSLKNGRVLYEPVYMKDAETPPSHVLDIESIALGFTDDFGAPVTSLVLRMSDDAVAECEDLPLSEDARIALALLKEGDNAFGMWRDNWLVMAEKLPSKKGANKGKKRNNRGLKVTFTRCVEALEERGLILCDRNNGEQIVNVELVRVTG